MKRILIISFLLAFLLPECFVLNAQNSIQGGMTINTTTIYQKKKEKKVLQPVKKGLQHTLTANYLTDFDGCFRGGIDYIAGYRFNKWFYAGVGIGLSFEDETYWQKNEEGDALQRFYEGDYIHPGFTVPLYLHAKAYINLSNKRYAPFFAVSTGVNIAGPIEVEYSRYDGYNSKTYYDNYNTTYLFFEPAVGFDYRLTSKISAYFQLGLNVHGISRMHEFDYTEEKVYCEKDSECDMSIRLGFVF